MRVVFLVGFGGVKRECASTDVFLPRRCRNPPEPRKRSGPKAVVFLHGFFKAWYSWRHQMASLANARYRTLAPDFRRYYLSDQPPEPEMTTFSYLSNDLLAILDHFRINKLDSSFSIVRKLGIAPPVLSLVLPSEISRVLSIQSHTAQACASLEPNYQPLATLVMVQKHHHTRLFAA